MSEKQAREHLRPLLMNCVTGSLDDHDAPVRHRSRQAARRGSIAVVELAGDERGWDLDTVELVPDGSHRARAHAAQRFRQTRNVIVHARGSHLGQERRPSALQTLEQGQAAPVVDEGLQPVVLNALRQRLVAYLRELPRRARRERRW